LVAARARGLAVEALLYHRLGLPSAALASAIAARNANPLWAPLVRAIEREIEASRYADARQRGTIPKRRGY
jgi:hypothetical protein